MKNLTFVYLLFVLTSCGSSNKLAYQQSATLWIQSSGEAKALIYQAYNLADLRLEQALKKPSKKPRAIIVDADETIVDNSPYQAKSIIEGKKYNSKSWGEWLELAEAKALPGSVEFLNKAKAKGVEVFFITNRSHKHYSATFKNLKDLGFPVSKNNLFLKKTKSSSKKSRRDYVAKKFNIIMLMGDSLGDFNDFFEHQSLEKRNALVDKFKNDFGKKFIVLPNPMYGEWLQSHYNYNYKLTDKQRTQRRLKALKPY